jgi:catechol 2,3-dioxygenase-like lactoylglutathione lyase family enzyme
MITGFHTIIYSDDAAVTRAFFRDVLEWPYLDAHDGWLLFKTPPSEIGVHPTSSEQGEQWGQVPYHQASLMCDDLQATITDLRAKGVKVDEPSDPMHDQAFIRALIDTYSIAPTTDWATSVA